MKQLLLFSYLTRRTNKNDRPTPALHNTLFTQINQSPAKVNNPIAKVKFTYIARLQYISISHDHEKPVIDKNLIELSTRACKWNYTTQD